MSISLVLYQHIHKRFNI